MFTSLADLRRVRDKGYVHCYALVLVHARLKLRPARDREGEGYETPGHVIYLDE